MAAESEQASARDESPDESSRGASVRKAGDVTLQQYHDWMQTNAAAHMIRAAREVGILAKLREGQHTLEQLCETLSIDGETTRLLIEALVAIGIVEQYEDDLALARAGHLLCQYDEDLGDARWTQLKVRLQQGGASGDDVQYRHRVAATQWVHTTAAMQAAEILNVADDVGTDDAGTETFRILDMGCGSGVFSCAIAHGVPTAEVLAIDQAAALQAASSTAKSIGMEDRFRMIESDPLLATVPENQFDLVVLAQQLSGRGDEEVATLLAKAAAALKPGGRIVAPDWYAGPGKPGLTEAAGRLALHLDTQAGKVRDLRLVQQQFLSAGFQGIQFTFLAASREGLGMVVGQK